MLKVIVGMSSLYLSKAHLHGNYTLSDFSTHSALQSHVTCQESQENGFPDVSVRDHKDFPFQDAMENACGVCESAEEVCSMASSSTGYQCRGDLG